MMERNTASKGLMTLLTVDLDGFEGVTTAWAMTPGTKFWSRLDGD